MLQGLDWKRRRRSSGDSSSPHRPAISSVHGFHHDDDYDFCPSDSSHPTKSANTSPHARPPHVRTSRTAFRKQPLPDNPTPTRPSLSQSLTQSKRPPRHEPWLIISMANFTNQMNSSSSSNYYQATKDVAARSNIQASAYTVDAASMALKGFHYSTCGAGGTYILVEPSGERKQSTNIFLLD